MRANRLYSIGLGLLFAACGEKSSGNDEADGGDGMAETSADGGGSDGADAGGKLDGGDDNGDTGSATTGADDGGSSGSDGGFISEPDGGGSAIECDVFAQDCPDGEKCSAWANDGGSSWNATRCSPVDPNPDQPGDACTVEGSGVSGIDSCDKGAMCWDVDPETNEGTCVALCTGSADAPECEGTTFCVIANDGVLNICLEPCDPLLQVCPDGQACYPYSTEGFLCAPDASGPDQGAIGDPCEFLNACDLGGACINPMLASSPECQGAAGCCAPFCDLDDAEADTTCQTQTGGAETCQPWFEEGMEIPGFENVGICALPA